MNQQFEELARGASHLRANVEKGDITVRAGDDWHLEWSANDGEEPQLQRDGSVIHVRQAPKMGFFGWQKLDLRLTVPASLDRIELGTGSGTVEAEGVSATAIGVTSGNGKIRLHQTRANTSITTGNGKIDVEDHTGDLTAATGNGKIQVENVEGEIHLNTGNGKIEVVKTDGRFHASTGNGELSLTAVSGEADINTGHGKVLIDQPRSLVVRGTTAMGSVRIRGGSVRFINLNSMMGDVECSAHLEPGKHALATAMGNVTVAVAAGSRARIDAQTSFGRIESDFPLVQVGRSGPMGFGGIRMVGSVGDGEADVDVHVRTAKGRLRILRDFNVTASTSGEQSAQSWTYASNPGESLSAAFSSDLAGNIVNRVMESVSAAFSPPPRPPAGPAPTATSPPPAESRESPPQSPADPVRAGGEVATSDDVQTPGPVRDQTLAILEAVARGEISPEEADRLLANAR